jgi:polysaccharide chain length determinant protein (PEP-CTERM system associated)
MSNPIASPVRPRPATKNASVPPEHYVRLLIHRKWLVLGVTLAISAGTAIVAHFLPNVYTSDTVILVDPQKVPETYVKSTVTGDVRNRLSTLSQQILSATRLQRIIETLNLYPKERKTLAREEVIAQMRSDIQVQVLSDFGASQDFQAFRITYSGKDARLVAQVTNELASLFIEENLKAREQQATGTAEFLQNQLRESRKNLEEQEAKLKKYRLMHVGEMPEQQSADLQILGQLQSQLQGESDALARAGQSKAVLQSLMTQSGPVVDLDSLQAKPREAAESKPSETPQPSRAAIQLRNDRARLAALLSQYTPDHPDVRKLRKQIQQDEAAVEAAASSSAVAQTPTQPPESATPPPAMVTTSRVASSPAVHVNPVIQSQINTLDSEIAKHKDEVQRLSKQVSVYQAKLSSIPVREQEIAQLVRDYEISRAHYSQLLSQQLSAETATQLEIRQKGEKFEVLDPGQVAERPSRPNRAMINGAGSVAGLILGIIAAIASEVLGLSITSTQDLAAAVPAPVLEVIPVILTRADRRRRRTRMILTSASAFATILAVFAVLLYRSQV